MSEAAPVDLAKAIKAIRAEYEALPLGQVAPPTARQDVMGLIGVAETLAAENARLTALVEAHERRYARLAERYYPFQSAVKQAVEHAMRPLPLDLAANPQAAPAPAETGETA